MKMQKFSHPLFHNAAGCEGAGFVGADVGLLGAEEKGDVGLGHAQAQAVLLKVAH
jgi:hypothetical protein